MLEGLRTRPCQVLRPNALNMTRSYPWRAQGKLREGLGRLKEEGCLDWGQRVGLTLPPREKQNSLAGGTEHVGGTVSGSHS